MLANEHTNDLCPVSETAAAGMSSFRLMCHIVSGAPYFLFTIILALKYRDNRRGESQQKVGHLLFGWPGSFIPLPFLLQHLSLLQRTKNMMSSWWWRRWSCPELNIFIFKHMCGSFLDLFAFDACRSCTFKRCFCVWIHCLCKTTVIHLFRKKMLRNIHILFTVKFCD